MHFPWCERKCPYCDFNSHEAAGAIPEEKYVSSLTADLNEEAAATTGPIQSVFFGGGTPSLIGAESIARLLTESSKLFSLTADAEITLEANPGVVDNSRVAGYRGAGVNRLSIGVQSFNDSHLRKLGRIHSSDDAKRAIRVARSAGFDNINLDLMHGLPDQTWTDAKRDLLEAISQEPEHISWYQLTIEPNTVFHRNPPKLPNETTLLEIYDRGIRLLEDNGYQRYEISAFARTGKQSKHNLNYWLFGDYLGIGAGAHGKLTADNNIYRTSKTRMPKDYLRNPRKKVTSVTRKDRPLEFMMNSLRLVDGNTLDVFEQRTLCTRDKISDFLDKALKQDFITSRNELRPTARGLRFLDEVLLLVD